MGDFELINAIICQYIIKTFYYTKDSAEDCSQLFQTYNLLFQCLRNKALINFWIKYLSRYQKLFLQTVWNQFFYSTRNYEISCHTEKKEMKRKKLLRMNFIN